MTFARSRYVVVTGTDTGVGKTVTTAALVAVLAALGRSVAVVKPVQTGVSGDEPGDIAEIVRLTGHQDVHEYVRLRPALAPESAALAEAIQLPTIDEVAARIRQVDADVVLVEGAGGLLVRMDLLGGTILDLAATLDAEVVIVARESLGTLNHVALTLAAVEQAGIRPRLVLGSCMADPGPAERSNHADIPRLTGRPIFGRLPEGAGALDRTEFCKQAPTWFEVPPAN